MIVRETPIPGVRVIEPEPVADHRGRFARVFCARELEQVLDGRGIVQVNHSLTRAAGAVRGMHFQRPPAMEMKFVRCVRGRAFDVALDLRPDSPTFLRWFACELDPESMATLVVPEGCAHGFQAMLPDTELVYLHTAAYAPGLEGGVRHDDPAAAIRWPLPVSDISARDRSYALLDPLRGGVAP